MKSLKSVLVLAIGLALALPAQTRGQARPALEYDGAIATGLALRRLGNTARLLHIAAHPDDENTALLVPLALGHGADAAYLSLTRGEGGQNSLGPDLGPALGLIRTEELLAARRIDGAGQFFTRAVDFGFSKNAEETFTHWPRDSVLADMVAVIRRYRPDVVVSVWSGTRHDGHGHHEASGLLAREAVLAAADPERFPEQIAAGLRPHEVARTYWSARFGTDGPDVELNTGEFDPLLGRSYHQIAMASRSRHRSQDMGARQAPGPRRTEFDRIDPADPPAVVLRSGGGPGRQLEGAPQRNSSLFAGVDTLLSQRAGGMADGVVEALREYERRVSQIRRAFDPEAPWRTVAPLTQAHRQLERAHRQLEAAGAGADALRQHLRDEQADLDAALLAVSGVELLVESDEELVVPGQTFELRLSTWNGGPDPVVVGMEAGVPHGWSSRSAGDMAGDERTVPPGELLTATFRVEVPDDAPLTSPYFLGPTSGDARGDLSSWPDDDDVRGLPFAPDAVRGRFSVGFTASGDVSGGAPGREGVSTADAHGLDPIVVERPARWVGVDPRRGEYRRPVRVVPRAAVYAAPELMIVPVGGERSTVPVSAVVRNQASDGTMGTLRAVVPTGWTVVPQDFPVTLAEPGEERRFRFEATPPADLVPGEQEIRIELRTADGSYELGYARIDYPHIDPHHLYRPAVVRVRALDVAVADVRVGYVPGVPDGVPEALDQLGVEWVSLDEAALVGADLSQFDVIITGTRAYEVRPDLVARNDRLLDWARDGGTLIVQYNKYPALEGSYAPWPVTISRPHGRVTDESAPVTVLEPDHPIFNTPNPIGPEAWEGWVQERGLYFWDTWEGPLRPLLAMSDPGEDPLEGSLLVAPLGDGTYVYSALALFRQLPEGVPGAWRLLANLVSLGAER